MAHYDPRKHPQWQAVRDAIKGEIIAPEDNGWIIPHGGDAADAMLNGLADVAIEAALALDQVVHN